MRLLIAGAGDLGTTLARQASDAGHVVTAVRRRPQHIPGCICLQGDLQQPAQWLPMQPDFDALLWCATPDQRDADGYREIYQNALMAVLDLWALRASVPKVVFCSSTAVYAEDGERHDESSTRYAQSWNGVALRAAELALQARLPTAVIARLGGIYGPDRTWLLRRVRAGDPVQERPPRWTNRIHVQDAAAALLRLLNDVHAPALCNVVDSDCSAEHTVMDWLAQQLKLPAPPRISGIALGKQVQPAALLRLGFAWAFPDFRRGYAAMLEE